MTSYNYLTVDIKKEIAEKIKRNDVINYYFQMKNTLQLITGSK